MNRVLTVVHTVLSDSCQEPYAGACSEHTSLKRSVTRVTEALTPAPRHNDGHESLSVRIPQRRLVATSHDVTAETVTVRLRHVLFGPRLIRVIPWDAPVDPEGVEIHGVGGHDHTNTHDAA